MRARRFYVVIAVVGLAGALVVPAAAQNSVGDGPAVAEVETQALDGSHVAGVAEADPGDGIPAVLSLGGIKLRELGGAPPWAGGRWRAGGDGHGVGPPDHAGQPGPPEHARGGGRPEHAGQPGPPDHARGDGRPDSDRD